MDHLEYCDAVAGRSAALWVAAEGSLDAAVPSCPEWDVGALVRHVGLVHRWAGSMVSERVQEPTRRSRSGAPGDPELGDWFRQGVEELLVALRDAGPDVGVWSWGPEQTSGFWARRMAHETAVHAYDAQLAAGTPEPVPPGLAADGVDEFLENLAHSSRAGPASAGTGETIHLHATDVDGEWLIRRAPEGAVVTREHAKGDVAVRGPASDLLLCVVGRVEPEELELFGDAEILDRWQRDVRF